MTPTHSHPPHEPHTPHHPAPPPSPWRAFFTPRTMVAIVASAAALGWLILPPGAIAVDDACRPAGFQPTVSALVTQGWFWQRQLDALSAERDDLLALQNRGDTDIDTEQMSNIEARMERLSHHEGSEVTQEQKEQLLHARQANRIARIAVLMQCADKIERHGRGF